MRFRHYYYWGEETTENFRVRKMNGDNWDILRSDEKKTLFSIEKSVQEYEHNCMNSVEYERMANFLTSCLKKGEFEKITSLGVGKGILEWHIKKRFPKVKIVCTDYAPKTIECLKAVFEDCDEIFQFDMMNDDFSVMADSDYVLMYRISTEFDYSSWKRIFQKMYDGGIARIIFIPTGLDGPREWFFEQKQHWKHIIKRRKDVFCGWRYSEKEFETMWRGSYVTSRKIDYDKTAVYFLTRQDGEPV